MEQGDEENSDGTGEDVDRYRDRFGFDYFETDRKHCRMLEQHGFQEEHIDMKWVPWSTLVWLLFKPRRMLEVGCGKGGHIAGWVRGKLGVDMVGIDVSEHAIDNAWPEAKPFVEQGSILDLPYPDGYSDLVCCYDVLEHIDEEDVDAAVSELCRVSSRHVLALIGTTDCCWSHTLLWDLTHVNLRPSYYWVRKFMEHGFGCYRLYPLDVQMITGIDSERDYEPFNYDYTLIFSKDIPEWPHLRSVGVRNRNVIYEYPVREYKLG